MIIILTFGTALGILVTFIAGYIIGRLDTRELNKEAIPYKKAVQLFQHATKPAGIFSDNPMPNFPSGPVYRPSARQLQKLHEPAQIKEEKEALAQSFAQDTELQRLKAEMLQYTK